MAAVEIGVSRDRIADRDAFHAGAGLHDLAGELMTDDARKLHRQAAGLDVLDGQPRAAGENARDRFARSGNGIGYLPHLEGRVRRR